MKSTVIAALLYTAWQLLVSHFVGFSIWLPLTVIFTAVVCSAQIHFMKEK